MEHMSSLHPATVADLESKIDKQLKSHGSNRLLTVSLSGPSGSGKSTVMAELQEHYPASIALSSDDYYVGLTRARRELPPELAETFESPRTMDLGKLATHLYMLKAGTVTEKPVYDMMASEPLARTETVDPTGKNLIIFEGLPVNLGLFKSLIDISACVTANLETRLARRIARDATRNGQTAAEITELFTATIEPAYEQFYRAADEQANFIIDTST